MSLEPWTVVPAFTRERLTVLADRLLAIRRGVLTTIDRDQGDSNWVIGCMVHERTRRQLARASAKGELPWLTAVATNDLRLFVKIGGVSIHLFRGDSLKPDGRHIDIGQEKRQLALFELGEAVTHKGWANYLVVETDETANGVSVVFFQADEAGNMRHHWTVPVDVSGNTKPTLGSVTQLARPGRTLEAPRVTARSKATDVSSGGA